MAHWSEGYVSDIAYTYGYYGELNPAQMAIPLLNAGLATPVFETACELGFGQGISLNAHAAASSTHWYGTDFNPEHASFAQEMARISGAGLKVVDDAFAEFCTRTDLPDFDFIGLHGIWSWISNDNRAVIVDFVRRKLKLGGVLYLSYNTLPGWAGAAPLRQILTDHAHTLGAPGQGMQARVDASLDFARRLLDLSQSYQHMVPGAKERLQQIAAHNRNYLAHEYFNRDWAPMYFSDLAQWLGPAKVGFACPANYLEGFDRLHLTAEQQAFLAEVPDPMLAQTVRDYLLNTQFRKDYWVKGARHLNTMQKGRQWRSMAVQLCKPASAITPQLGGRLGQVDIKPEVFEPLMAQLQNLQPHSVGDLAASIQSDAIPPDMVYHALTMLHGRGDLAVVQDEAVQQQAQPRTRRLNSHLASRACADGDIPYLASPVTGGAVVVPRFSQLFLAAQAKGHRSAAELAQFVWSTLQEQGQHIVLDQQPLTTAEANLAHLNQQAQTWLDQHATLHAALGLALEA